uniref:GGDEF domain-containing protein n=1 Tax=Succinivibrio sp. TaxID=2053619 RepID=UPI00386BF947
DEFVVLAVHVSSKQDHHMENKITLINQELSNTEDGLPATSISAGIVRGDANSNFDSLLREADEALYITKNEGKHGCTFYRRNAADKQITSGISE